mmetsp:Transcript_49222/g.151979  ORF Transcript_49222/g.151979 Transcript_49222/m.151979 type:complete len:386 (-) Transcript_49222:90-1247(-)
MATIDAADRITGTAFHRWCVCASLFGWFDERRRNRRGRSAAPHSRVACSGRGGDVSDGRRDRSRRRIVCTNGAAAAPEAEGAAGSAASAVMPRAPASTGLLRTDDDVSSAVLLVAGDIDTDTNSGDPPTLTSVTYVAAAELALRPQFVLAPGLDATFPLKEFVVAHVTAVTEGCEVVHYTVNRWVKLSQFPAALPHEGPEEQRRRDEVTRRLAQTPLPRLEQQWLKAVERVRALQHRDAPASDDRRCALLATNRTHTMMVPAQWYVCPAALTTPHAIVLETHGLEMTLEPFFADDPTKFLVDGSTALYQLGPSVKRTRTEVDDHAKHQSDVGPHPAWVVGHATSTRELQAVAVFAWDADGRTDDGLTKFVCQCRRSLHTGAQAKP